MKKVTITIYRFPSDKVYQQRSQAPLLSSPPRRTTTTTTITCVSHVYHDLWCWMMLFYNNTWVYWYLISLIFYVYKVPLRNAGNMNSRGRCKAKRETPVTRINVCVTCIPWPMWCWMIIFYIKLNYTGINMLISLIYMQPVVTKLLHTIIYLCLPVGLLFLAAFFKSYGDGRKSWNKTTSCLAFLLYLGMCTIATSIAEVPGYGAHAPVTISKQGARPRSLAPTEVQDNHYLSLRSVIWSILVIASTYYFVNRQSICSPFDLEHIMTSTTLTDSV